MTFEDYLKVRTFLFLHHCHFSGRNDNLRRSVEEECAKLGVKVGTRSCDIDLAQNLLDDEPYKSHKLWGRIPQWISMHDVHVTSLAGGTQHAGSSSIQEVSIWLRKFVAPSKTRM